MTSKSQKKQSPRATRDPLAELKTGRDVTVSVGRWTRYMAAREASQGGAMATALHRDGETASSTDAAWGGFARETFARFYGLGESEGAIPEDKRPAGHEWTSKLHEHADSLPEWRALMERTKGDPWAAGMATGQLMDSARRAVAAPSEDLAALEEEAEFIRELSAEKGRTSPKHLKRLADLNLRVERVRRESEEALADASDSAVRVAMRALATSVNGTLDEMDAAMSGIGLGAGNGAGIASRVTSPREEVRGRLLANPRLMRVLKIAGRLKVRAAQKQRTKAPEGAEELCDLTAGADLARLVPSELANLADEMTEALLYRRLMERSAMCYELRGRETRAAGPIVMVVDESGSMSGARDETAKACAMAMMELAAKQKRAFAYVRFDSRVVGVDRFEKPAELTIEQIEDFVTRFAGGGTCISSGLASAAQLLSERGEPWPKADVILVSDGAGYDGDERNVTTQIEAIKAAGAHIYAVLVGNDRHSPAVLAGADEIVRVSDGGLEELDQVFAV